MTGQLSEWGRRNRSPRDEFDDYPTPLSFTNALLDREGFRGLVWEPAAGSGWLVKGLMDRGVSAIGTDLREGRNFLTWDPPRRLTQNIVTNPPYKLALPFALRAVSLARLKVALLVRLTFLEGQKRYSELFEPFPPARIWITTRRMNTAEKGGGGSFAHCWVVWDREHEGPPEVGWFTPTGDIFIPKGKP